MLLVMWNTFFSKLLKCGHQKVLTWLDEQWSLVYQSVNQSRLQGVIVCCVSAHKRHLTMSLATSICDTASNNALEQSGHSRIIHTS